MANRTINQLYYHQYKENSRTRWVKYMVTNWCVLLNTTQFSQWKRKKMKKKMCVKAVEIPTGQFGLIK